METPYKEYLKLHGWVKEVFVSLEGDAQAKS